MKFLVEFYDGRRKPRVINAKSRAEAIVLAGRIVRAGFSVKKVKNSRTKVGGGVNGLEGFC